MVRADVIIQMENFDSGDEILALDEQLKADEECLRHLLKLQRIVDSGNWRNNLLLRQSTYHQYLQLRDQGIDVANLGSRAFWDVSEQGGSGNSKGDHPPTHFYNMEETDQPIYARRFNTERHRYRITFRNTDDLVNAPVQMEEIFDDIINRVTSDRDNGSTGLEIRHPTLDKPIFVPLSKNKELNGLKLLNAFLKVMQSKTELRTDETLEMITIAVQSPAGGVGNANKRRSITCNLTAWMKSHSGHGGFLIQISNTNDNSCLSRAIVVARARIHKDDPASPFNYDVVRKGDRGNKTSEQKCQAAELMKQSGLENHKGLCGIPELEKIQAVLTAYKIKVFSLDAKGPIFIGQANDAADPIHLFLQDDHYTVVTSMPAFFGNSYWCESCNKSYSNREDHRCALVCNACYCKSSCAKLRTVTALCQDCNRYFYNEKCFENHKRVYENKGATKRKKIGRNVCDRIKRCTTCDEHMRCSKKKPHKCGYFECRTCRKVVEKENHLCYMQKIGDESESDGEEESETDESSGNSQNGLGENDKEQPPVYVFYDFECTQELEIATGVFKHEPNLCIAHIVCEQCRQDMQECERCGEHRKLFWGKDCLNDFASWLFSNTKRNIIAIAHNSKGYDSQFIMTYLLKNGILPKIVNKGLEMMSICVGKVRLIDSLNFLPMPLSALPKAFGIEELAKGWFPHFFNKVENWDYVGPWPVAEDYGPDSMNTNIREKFEKWYATKVGEEFNFREEITKYCESDVDILRRCCLEFRDIFMQKTDIDPFEKSLTIAGACNRVFRTNFLESDTIGLVPHGGYRRKDKQSVVALKWLKWISHSHNINIQHAQNGPEQHIGKYKVDGLADKTVFEYYGCYWHGCPQCMYKRFQRTADYPMTAQAAYERTIQRQLYIELRGYHVNEIWDCQLVRELAANPAMKTFFESIKIMEPMNPREAFFGGRTNAVKLYDIIRRDENGQPLERIDYVDICSLYPFICKYGAFPKGHPEIITENFLPLESKPYDGLIKCKILPPTDLYNPLLPYRSGGKLTFPLCAKCANERNADKCDHSDDDRAITGAWVSLEVYEALKLGYQMLELYEVWHYSDIEQYDKETNPDGGLFTGYINEFIKMKQEADGWPSWVQNEEDKDRYVTEYEEYEGVQLDQNNIEKNPGLRALAKLMLNSFWGKFGQRNNMGKVEYFTEPDKYFRHINEPGRIVHAINIVSETMMSVTSTFEDEFVDILPNTNPVIAAYTTAQARLKLYSYIEKLDRRVLYFDTDSIIYKTQLVAGDDQYKVPIGSYLGFMTDELEKEYGVGSYITEFVSGGPKNYAYKTFSTNDSKEHINIKVKGFALTSSVSKIINMECLKNLVFDFVNKDCIKVVPIHFKSIERTRDHDIVTKTSSKRYRVVYDKRVVRKDFSTVPYGYVNSELENLIDEL